MAANYRALLLGNQGRAENVSFHQGLPWPVASQFLGQRVTCCCGHSLLMQLQEGEKKDEGVAVPMLSSRLEEQHRAGGTRIFKKGQEP